MRIAVCDDENVWISYIEEFIIRIKKVYTETEYDVFSSGSEILEYYKKNGNIYDIVILDIEMDDLLGIAVANEIRKMDNSVIIFFLTSHKEYVFDCFKPQPLNFWIKPVSYEQFENDICAAYTRIEESGRCLKITENRKCVRIKCDDIIYIENKERKSWIYTVQKKYSSNKLLSDIETQLDSKIFVRTYKSFIVNLKYVHILGDSELTLYNTDTKIPISRTYKKRLTEIYINFQERKLLEK